MPTKTENLATEILVTARLNELKITTAESCTGGLIAGALTAIAGSSDVFERGFITYSNEAKQQMLSVSHVTLEKAGAVSEAVAKEMAYGALANSMADVAVSVTGVAGPGGGSPDKPVGTVCFGIAQLGLEPVSEKVLFSDKDRTEVRALSVNHALTMLLNLLK